MKSTQDSNRTGYVQVYTGDGKGKTTAAFGLALRAAGAGLKIFIGQFLKNGKYSETIGLERFSDLITIKAFGRDGYILGNPQEEDMKLAQKGLGQVKNAINSGNYKVVILDEANIAIFYELFSVDELLNVIDSKPNDVELIITGRRAHPKLIEKADLVTEMREIKHYYKQGVKARVGIEK